MDACTHMSDSNLHPYRGATGNHLALIQRQVDSSERHIEIIRYVYENVLEVIMKVGDTIARASFESV